MFKVVEVMFCEKYDHRSHRKSLTLMSFYRSFCLNFEKPLLKFQPMIFLEFSVDLKHTCFVLEFIKMLFNI